MKVLYFISLIMITTAVKAQVLTNGGFENWNTTDTKNPVGWGSLNWTATFFSAPFTCIPTTDAYAGKSAMKLESIIYDSDTLDGFAFTGIWPGPTMGPEFGYPYTKRPVSLKGYYKFSSPANDSFLVYVYFTKWNTSLNRQDSIGEGFFYGKKSTNYIKFEAPIKYSSSVSPDTATVIVLCSSKSRPTVRGIPGNTLIVDELSFEFSSGMSEPLNFEPVVQIYPNPLHNNFTITIPDHKNAGIKIYDLNGREILNKIPDSEKTLIDSHTWKEGIYIIETSVNGYKYHERIIKNP